MLAYFSEIIDRELEDQTSDLDYRVLEIESRIRSKQYIEAVDLIDAVFKMERVPIHHKANLYRLVGDCFAKLGDLDGAKDAYHQAAELDPFMPKIYIGLGTLGLMRNSFDLAVLNFQKAVNLAPDDEMANLGLGLAFQGMNEAKEAQRWILKALHINPLSTAALFSLVRISHESNYYDDAISAVKVYLQKMPNDLNFLYTLAGLQFKYGSYNDCLASLQSLLAKDPQDQRALALLRQTEEAMRETRKAPSSGS